MTPHYVFHKAGTDKGGRKRKTDSYIFYYICAKHQEEAARCDHSNRIPASKTEAWALNLAAQLISGDALLDQIIAKARERSQADLTPTFEALKENAEALRAVALNEEKLFELATNGDVSADLLDLLNGRATRIKAQKQELLVEKAHLKGIVATAQVEIDVEQIRKALSDINSLLAHAPPQEMQHLLKLLIHRIEWSPKANGQEQKNYKGQIYSLLPKTANPPPLKRSRGMGLEVMTRYDTA